MNKSHGGMLINKTLAEPAKVYRSYARNSNFRLLVKGTAGIVLLSNLFLPVSPDSPWKVHKNNSTNLLFYRNQLTGVTQYDIPQEALDNADASFPIYYKKISPDNTFGKPVTSLITKLCVIYDKMTPYNTVNKKLYTVTPDEFESEVEIQSFIYRQTVADMQPLCPAIVFSQVISKRPEIASYLQLLMDNGENTIHEDITMLLELFDRNSDIKLGVIAMEYLDGAVSLGQYVRLNNKKDLNNIFRYALLKMALETGYNHNDFHNSNLMFIRCNNYFNSPLIPYRPIIIDFGRTTLIPINVMSRIREEAAKGNYNKALAYLCDYRTGTKYISSPEFAESHYGWVCGDYNMYDRDYYNSLITYKTDQANKEIFENNMKKGEFAPFETEDRTKSYINKQKQPSQLRNFVIGEYFRLHKEAVANNTQIMAALHAENPFRYPTIPLSANYISNLYDPEVDTFIYSEQTNFKKQRK